MSAPLMTPDEVAACLRVHRGTVYRLVKSGGLRAYKVSGRIRFKTEDVEDYLERSLVQPSQGQEVPNIVRFQYKPGMRVVSL